MTRPVAWLHTMDNTDGLPENKPSQKLTFSPDDPFGTPGVDYDASYTVTSTPLYTKEDPPVPKNTETWSDTQPPPDKPGLWWGVIRHIGPVGDRNFANCIIEVHGTPGYMKCCVHLLQLDMDGPKCITDVPVTDLIFIEQIDTSRIDRWRKPAKTRSLK